MKFFPQIDDFLILIDGGGVETGIEKNIVEYDVPFTDGAVCDDLGVKARQFRFKTIWAKELYDHYEDFLEHAAKDEPKTFIHPELGIVIGRIKNLTVVHDRKKNCATIEIVFVEDKGADVSPVFEPLLTSAMEDEYIKTVEAVVDATEKKLDAQGFDTKRSWLSGVLNVLAFIKNATAAVNNIARQIQRGLDAMNSVINTITSAVNSVASLVTFVATLPGAIVGSITRAFDSIVSSLKSIANSPKLFMNTLKNALKSNSKKAEGMENVATIVGAATAAVVVAGILEDDAENRKIMINNNDESFLPGTQNAPMPPPVFTADDLDVIEAGMTEIYNDAISAAREEDCPEAATSLVRGLANIKRFIENQKHGTERIITVNIETPMPLHAILLRHNIPISYADRIMLINDIKNPNFVSGNVRLYERRN